MVGRLLSFSDGIFSGAMLNFQGVTMTKKLYSDLSPYLLLTIFKDSISILISSSSRCYGFDGPKNPVNSPVDMENYIINLQGFQRCQVVIGGWEWDF